MTFPKTGYLTDNGAEDGSIAANVDGSVTPVEFSYQPSLYGLGDMLIARLIIHIGDEGGFQAARYGGIVELTNGIRVFHRRGSVDTAIDGKIGIKNNAHWARLCYDAIRQSFGAGEDFFTVRWSYNRYSDGLILKETDRIVVQVNDDLTGLTHHNFVLQGFETSGPS